MAISVLESLSRPTGTLSNGWRVVRFGDVVRSVKETVDAETSGLERYVAGEHMDTDDLHIRRWGAIGESYLGPAFHRRFVAGQVLYGSRRTYLRKVAVADFDGVCANTTFVLEPATEDLLPDLLPFIMQTEAFTEHSVKQSKGSVNPYINWKDIAWYEFPLPPLDEQRRIAELLWAADNAMESWRHTAGQLDDLASSTFRDLTNKDDELWPILPLGDLLLSAQYGTSRPSGDRTPGALPVLRIPNVVAGAVDTTNLAWLEVTPEERQRFLLQAGDILVVRTNGNPDYVGRCAMYADDSEQAIFASYLIRLRFDRGRVYPKFVNLALSTEPARRMLRQEVRSTAGNYNINAQGLRKQVLVLPPLHVQEHISATMTQILASADVCREHAALLHRLVHRVREFLLCPTHERS